MRKLFLGLSFFTVMVTLTACGGGEANSNLGNNQEAMVIDITDIMSGYQLNGIIQSGQKAGEEAILIYCPNMRYSYYRGSDEKFYGDYKINNDQTEVVMTDDTDGGSYALQTPNHIFKEGEFYSCRGLSKYTTGLLITKIVPNPCPNNQ